MRIGRTPTPETARRGLPDFAEALPASYWKDLLRRHAIRPAKRLGQNFLIDPHALSMVVEAAELSGDETVLEIGSGLGVLTRLLLDHAQRVVAIEVDRRLERGFREAVGPHPRLAFVLGDFLRIDWASEVGPGPYAVVANIPYSLTSHLIRRLLEAQARPFRIVLTLQREVVDRILSSPGDMSLLSLSVQVYGVPRAFGRIEAASFFPSPAVDSEILRIDVHESPRVPAVNLGPMFRAARAGFGQKRKQLRNALAAGLQVEAAQAASWLEQAGIRPSRRAQELEVEEWGRLAEALASGQTPAEPAVGRRSRGPKPR
ncbi:MAG: 16S rRNA (adenine(1518)-N(6)/adenine(1519)-N(6))-dimethyltransferase RsmA [Anaerolineales bacterium]